jgi:hypothetical protein
MAGFEGVLRKTAIGNAKRGQGSRMRRDDAQHQHTRPATRNASQKEQERRMVACLLLVLVASADRGLAGRCAHGPGRFN